ncbi:MAG: hypothetical protein AAF234_05820 [Pseudomonadota bacterium]
MTIKDAGLRIRIDKNLRERFLEVCRAQDKPAAQVIREFMREYVQAHKAANDVPVTQEKQEKAVAQSCRETR